MFVIVRREKRNNRCPYFFNDKMSQNLKNFEFLKKVNNWNFINFYAQTIIKSSKTPLHRVCRLLVELLCSSCVFALLVWSPALDERADAVDIEIYSSVRRLYSRFAEKNMYEWTRKRSTTTEAEPPLKAACSIKTSKQFLFGPKGR